jgi:glycosyltransferase involved in cell wall biosynthesis
MGYGKAILSSDIKENQEPLSDEVAVFFQSGNAQDLEKKLVSLINSPLAVKKMGELAREKAIRQFSWDTIVEKIEKVYIEVLAQKRGKKFFLKSNEKRA